MKLIIIRHAAAIERTTDVSEEHRYLTPEGREYFRKTARTMGQRGIDPDLILTSPLIRAVQTADILAEAIAYSGPLQVATGLGPGFNRRTLQKLLQALAPLNELAIVGHEPDLSLVVASLLALPKGFNFKKGTAIKLNVGAVDTGAKATFKWLAAGNQLIREAKEAFA